MSWIVNTPQWRTPPTQNQHWFTVMVVDTETGVQHSNTATVTDEMLERSYNAEQLKTALAVSAWHALLSSLTDLP